MAYGLQSHPKSQVSWTHSQALGDIFLEYVHAAGT